MSHKERIIEMEERVTFQERALDQLNRVVAEQQLEIDALVREVRDLRKLRLAAGPGDAESDARQLEDDRPPHY